MKRIITIAILICSIYSARAQSVKAYTAEQLMHRATSSDTVYIINFWATWCVPCVHELPEFDVLQKRYEGKPVKIIMASLDFKESYPDKLAGFIHKRNMLPEVVWFNETDANTFIPKVDSTWLGSIPCTLILHKSTGYRKFIEEPITSAQIGEIADKQLATK